MGRSKYRNYDLPFGYKKSSDEKYKDGIKIDGVVYKIVTCLFDSGIFEMPDCTGLSDFELTDSDDTGDHIVKAPCRSTNEITDDSSDDEIDKFIKYRKRMKSNETTDNKSERILKLRKRGIGASDDENDRMVKHRKRTKLNETTDDESDGMIKPRKRANRITGDSDRIVNFGKRAKARRRHDESDRVLKHRRGEHKFHRMFYSSVPHVRIKKEEESCEKRKKTSKVHEVYECENSYSPPFSPISSHLQNNEVALKDPSLQPPNNLFGYFFCEVCNLDLSSEKVYCDHMSGKRHRKNLKTKHVAQAVAHAIPPSATTEGESKYPRPPHGVIRRKVKQRAKIQDVIKNEVKKPCPGLHLVTEIQGLTETQYYCSICNSICSPNSIISHLIGFKHQLNSVKYFRPGDYETFHRENKGLIQGHIISILRGIQKEEGLGRMTVEIEELIADDGDNKITPWEHSIAIKDVEGRSLKDSGLSFPEYYDQATVPNKSSSDYFCVHCDAHMNSEDMWQAHITGKRHITNLKKLPGDRPSKTKTVPLLNARAKLLDRLKEECPDEPVLGLDEVREVQIKETNSESYHCFLCSSCHTSLDIVEHLVSLKHRQKYLSHIEFPYMQYISGMSELAATPVIKDICVEVEAECGSGTPSVHINKSAFYG